MRRGPAGRNATLAAIGVFALVGFLAGAHARPAPVSAGYCDDYPELCTTFTVAATGTGSGTVTTADGSINCQYSAGSTSGTCSKRFIEDGNGHVQLTISYIPAATSYVCDGPYACWSTTNTFELQIGGNPSIVRPTFSPKDCSSVPDAWCARLTIGVKGAGKGTVKTGDGRIDCARNAGVTSGTCSYDYWMGPEGGFTPQIGVIGTAAAGSEVCEDSDCGSTRSFATAFSSDSSFTFSFALLNYGLTVSKTGTGSGRVIGSAGGIDCGSTCTGTFHYDDTLTLAAVSNAGSTFQGWTGACAGQDATCDLTITGAVTTAATFVSSPGTTPGTIPTLAPGPTPTPGAGAPATSVTPGASAAATNPAATAETGAGASVAPSVTVPGASATDANAGATDGATAAPTVPAAGDPSGGSVLLLALAIVIAGIVIAIGLAVGLRGRSNMEAPRPDPPSG